MLLCVVHNREVGLCPGRLRPQSELTASTGPECGWYRGLVAVTRAKDLSE